jgi:Castor and Pollux, part of voltage-gated ion channel
MIIRILNRFKTTIERFILMGAQYQLLFIAVLIVLISLSAGILVLIATSDFKLIGESAWWAFLRLTDPGYLGDDKGFVLRTVSTVVTILGYVLFMGALIAIMTQWLHRTLKKLESGLTPIAQNDHILILGWTNRCASIVEELLVSEGRVKRFLRRIGAGKLHIVILAEEVSTETAYDLKERLGRLWKPKQITFRSGTPLRLEHLERVDFLNTAVMIIPGSDFISEGSDMMDTRTVKSLLTVSTSGKIQQRDGKLPLVAAEIFDRRKIPIAKAAYKGEMEIIPSDSVISRLIAQNVRHQGLSYIYSELLSHGQGNEIYVRQLTQLNGEKLHNIFGAFPRAILLGVLRPRNGGYLPLLNPAADLEITAGDRLVFLARRYAETEPAGTAEKGSFNRNTIKTHSDKHIKKRMLILGWNQRIPSVLQEFDSYRNESFDIDLLSLIPISKRNAYIDRHDLHLRNVKMTHIEGDYTSPSDLERIKPKSYDNIIFLSNSWLDSNEESDARTILGYLLLQEMIAGESDKPEILIEMMDPENEKLFKSYAGEVIVSPLILSHILAHVALRRELNVVFEELFTVGGAEIYFRPSRIYGISDRDLSFRQIEETVFSMGDIALGVRIKNMAAASHGLVSLNPPRNAVWRLKDSDEIVVLTTYHDKA